MGLLDLNYDVLHHLISFIDPQHALPHTVLACRKTYDVGMPMLVSDVKLRRHQCIMQFAHFLVTKPTYSSFVRALEINTEFFYNDDERRAKLLDGVCDIVTACERIRTLRLGGVEEALYEAPRLSNALKGLKEISALYLHQFDGDPGIGDTTSKLLSELHVPLTKLDMGPLDHLARPSGLWNALGRFSGTLQSISLQCVDLRDHDLTRLRLPRVHTMRLEYVDVHIAELERVFPNVRIIDILNDDLEPFGTRTLEQNRAHSCRIWRELLVLKGSVRGLGALGFTGCHAQYLGCDLVGDAEESDTLCKLVRGLNPRAMRLAFEEPRVCTDTLACLAPCTQRLVMLEIQIVVRPYGQVDIPDINERIDKLPDLMGHFSRLSFLRLRILPLQELCAFMSLNRGTAANYARQIFVAIPSLRVIDMTWDHTTLGRHIFIRDQHNGPGRSATERAAQAGPRLRDLSLETLLGYYLRSATRGTNQRSS